MKLLLVSDFARHSGFAIVAEAIAAQLRAAGWEISVLAVNYRGDPHPLQAHYALYPAAAGGDLLGVNRIARLVAVLDQDVVLIISDPWVVTRYLTALDEGLERQPPVVAYMPVDAPDLLREAAPGLDRLAAAIAYTHFGAAELARVGAPWPAVIPHGIDRAVYAPLDRAVARQHCGIDPDWFVVLLLDRNQPRKALDIAVDGFADWIEQRRAVGLPTAHLKLIYHGALRDAGWPIDLIARDRGIDEHFIVTDRSLRPLSGVSVEDMRAIYSAADVRLTTTVGEGWGLTLMEAMACGVPVVAPAWSAVGEWAEGAYHPLPIVLTRRHRETLTRMGETSHAAVVEALTLLYSTPDYRAALSAKGLALVSRPEYTWEAIGAQFDTVLRAVVARSLPVEEVAA